MIFYVVMSYMYNKFQMLLCQEKDKFHVIFLCSCLIYNTTVMNSELYMYYKPLLKLQENRMKESKTIKHT